MDFYTMTADSVLSSLGSGKDVGLSRKILLKNQEIYGKNVISSKKKESFISKLFSALTEPMMLILLFSLILTFGINLGKLLKNGESDFSECIGIFLAVILSVGITLVMEGSSNKAFSALNKIYDNLTVKVLRDGEIIVLRREYVVVGDIVFLEAGDKIIADGRLISSRDLRVDESALTGESGATYKDANVVLEKGISLAERKNCVYSGTFVTSGEGVMVVFGVGDKTEIGNIAKELKNKKELPSPLNQKMAKLGKTVTLIGVFSAIFVFICTLTKLILTKSVTFSAVQNLFVSSVILIVAAVPEGLPTIVAVSLALNMIKLAKENALIKKLTATETAGAVSVICSDKTGTLTENKMTLVSIRGSNFIRKSGEIKKEELLQNFICNSTADVIKKDKDYAYKGSGTECALIVEYLKSTKKKDYNSYRNSFKVIERVPFSSGKKYMTTTILYGTKRRKLIKGAPEKIIPLCELSEGQIKVLYKDIAEEQNMARRILCFAHDDGDGVIFDGYAVLFDSIRKEVKEAVKDCKSAGIKIKILTGDNRLTATAVGKELGVVYSESQVINGNEIENLSVFELKKILPKITVIARSTPIVKLKVVKALKELGEVVAVTGDGINDAPAIKHADVGIAMGKSGSEITKEAADVVLIDDSFATIVKAVAFGRNVYRNLQRFILFQLSVNVSALVFITVSAILGYKSPFNTLQLLWINVIMDGPPAITLGLYNEGKNLMKNLPVKREQNIVGKNMLFRIIFGGLFMAIIMCLQHFKNILGVSDGERKGATFTLFIVFQLFNAFNSREIGMDGILKNLNKNKIMAVTFLITFIIQVFIVQVAYPLFDLSPLKFLTWIKILALGFSVVLVTELYKTIYKAITVGKKNLKKANLINKNQKAGIN